MLGDLTGRAIGKLGALLGVLGACAIAVVFVAPGVSLAGGGLSLVPGLAGENAVVAAFWTLVVLAASALAYYAFENGRRYLHSLLAVGFLVLSVLGAFTIGPYVLAAAVVMIVGSLVSWFEGSSGEPST